MLKEKKRKKRRKNKSERKNIVYANGVSLRLTVNYKDVIIKSNNSEKDILSCWFLFLS